MNESLRRTVHEITAFDNFNSQIKTIAPYYPQIAMEENLDTNVTYYFTKVRILRNDIWYAIYCMNSIMLGPTFKPEYALRLLMDNVYQVQYLYVIQDTDVPDPLQISEADRLRLIRYTMTGK